MLQVIQTQLVVHSSLYSVSLREMTTKGEKKNNARDF